MSDDTIEVGSDLWLEVDTAELVNSGLFDICDSTGGKAMIDVEEIPALIEALEKVVKKKADGDTLGVFQP